jgi:hypothetical protein
MTFLGFLFTLPLNAFVNIRRTQAGNVWRVKVCRVSRGPHWKIKSQGKNILNIRVKYVLCVTLQYSLEILVSSVIIYRVEGKIRANTLLNFHVRCRLFWFKFSQNCTVRTIGIINQCLLPLKNESNISSAFSNCYMRTDRQTDRPRDRYIMKNTVTIFQLFIMKASKEFTIIGAMNH